MSALKAIQVPPGSKVRFDPPAPPKLDFTGEIHRAAKGEPLGTEMARIQAELDRRTKGFNTRGLLFPDGATRDMNITTDTAGGFLKGENFQKTYFNTPYDKSLVSKLEIPVLPAAGVSYATGIAVAPVAEFLAEGSELTEAWATFNQRLIAVKNLGCKVTLTRQHFVATGGFGVDVAKQEISTAMRKKADEVVFGGSGVDGNPLGVALVPGLPVYTPSGAWSWADAAAIKKDRLDAGVDPDLCSYVVSSDVMELLEARERVAGSGRYIIEDGEMGGRPVYSAPGLPEGLLLYGDYAAAVAIYDLGVYDVVVHPLDPSGAVRTIVWRYVDVTVPRLDRVIKVSAVS
ncbi:phage major capsid protein [bacterium]|nr:phage major capsid protein [bacterium]